MTEIAPMETLFDTHLLAMPMAAPIQPTEIVESHRVHYEIVPVPSADRITQPRRRRIVGKFSRVTEDLAEDGVYFVQYQNFTRGLNDLEGLRHQIGTGHSLG